MCPRSMGLGNPEGLCCPHRVHGDGCPLSELISALGRLLQHWSMKGTLGREAIGT